MGSLSKSPGATVKREIKLVDATGFNASQIETEFNDNWGSVGWRIIQAIILGSKTFLILEKEV